MTNLFAYKIAFEPVRSEHDELIDAINADQFKDALTLDETPDPQQLESFWNGVEEDIQSDPNWITFTDES